MTSDPVMLDADESVRNASRCMRDRGVGDVLICEAQVLVGIATDRDIVVHVVAAGRDPNEVRLREVASYGVTSVGPDDDLDDVVAVMKVKAVRRVPVVSNGRPVGIVSLGDLITAMLGDSELDAFGAEVSIRSSRTLEPP
jgi:CBS domain-containing protein